MGAIVNRAKPYQALSAQSSYKSGLAMDRRLSFFPAMKLFLLTLSVACALVAATPANRTSLLPQVTISETPEGRIVLGYPAPEGKAPYIVGLLIRTDGSNGAAVGAGTIIANNWVLTAAHCLTTDSVDIHYGSNWGWNGAFSHNVRRDNFISHPDWPSQAGKDIGLIRTPHVDFNNLVNKIPLPSFSEENERFQDTWCVACGWGGMDNGDLADWLQCIDVQIISNSECESAYGSVSGNDMCTRQSDGRSVCGGDSGGPLVTHDNARLVGVITFASVGCHNGPSGYTRVTDYLGWIRDHTGISY